MKSLTALVGGLILLAWMSASVVAQEAQEAAPAEDSENVETPDDAIFDDDIFKPSETIEADSEISFPADI
ncbi:MAG: hypothetical protein AB8G16_08635 [Gammaproteobacteria bacterium]